MKRLRSNPRGLTVTNVAHLTGMTRQAIHYNIKAGYLSAVMDDSGKYYISRVDYWRWRSDYYTGVDIKEALI